jgi:hypothetical protein
MSRFGRRFEPREQIDCECEATCTCEQDAQDAFEADCDDRNDAIRKGEW